MKNSIDLLARGIADQKLLDHPKVTSKGVSFGVHAPVTLIEAFKTACNYRGEHHPIVVRTLMANYVDGVLESMRNNEDKRIEGQHVTS